MISRSISARLGASVAALLVFVVSAAGVSRGAGAASGPTTFDHPYLDGFSGPEPAVSVNLAGTWQFETKLVTTCAPTPPGIVFGPPEGCVDTPVAQRTTIQVPGGGWVKQGFANVSRAVYGRTIDVPDIGAPQVTKMVFGAVNHEATVSIDGRVVGTNTTAYLPSVFDLTPFVRPGASHVLTVDVKGRDVTVRLQVSERDSCTNYRVRYTVTQVTACTHPLPWSTTSSSTRSGPRARPPCTTRRRSRSGRRFDRRQRHTTGSRRRRCSRRRSST